MEEIMKRSVVSMLVLAAAIAFTSTDVKADTVKPPQAPSVAPSSSGVPASTCRPGYVQQGFWLCMTGARGLIQFDNATVLCQDIGGRVADVSDWRYRIFRGDGVSAPVGWWLGTRSGDEDGFDDVGRQAGSGTAGS
jgi:hypothetical protein